MCVNKLSVVLLMGCTLFLTVASAMLAIERDELTQKYDECVSASASKMAEPNEAKEASQPDVLPTTMTVGGRVYDIFGFLRGNEKFVEGHTMVERAKEMNAHLGQDDGQHLLDHQDEIPVALRGKVVFVFTDWRYLGVPEHVAYVYWDEDSQRWILRWDWLGDDGFDGDGRVLRRK